MNSDTEYVPIVLEDRIDNPVALARMRAHVTQKQLAQAMGVSQAYISQLEVKSNVTSKTLEMVYQALASIT